MKGTLWIVPTPIGNLGDVSQRVLETLQNVDMIAAEDTRRTKQLLSHFEIRKPLTSYHEHNKAGAGEKLIAQLLQGKSIALVSDAGMPGISDPGADLVADAIQSSIEVEVIPGPTAFVNALILSGLDTTEFHFFGFLDRQKKARNNQLEKLEPLESTLIFYEAPHRLKQTLKDLHRVLGDREIAVARELTKKFEEVLRGTITEMIRIFDEREIRGEFVLVVAGRSEPPEVQEEKSAEEWLLAKIDEGMTKKEAIRWVADRLKVPKRDIYALALKLFEDKK